MLSSGLVGAMHTFLPSTVAGGAGSRAQNRWPCRGSSGPGCGGLRNVSVQRAVQQGFFELGQNGVEMGFHVRLQA
jgi:hypothetical protein